MRIGIIGDIVGRHGRTMVQRFLPALKESEGLDFVVANYENASHGFGLTPKNAHELLSYGIDAMSGGNHTWDKKEIIPLLSTLPLLRPLNYPPDVPGEGLKIFDVAGERLALINLMGYYGMPMVQNPFLAAREVVDRLKKEGVRSIVIDMHAEATSEKRALFMMLKEHVSIVYGTHTHVGTDDLMIDGGCAYVSDVGLTGCRDNVIGMDAEVPIKRFLTGLPGRFDLPKRCRKILQILIVTLKAGRSIAAYKIKLYDEGDHVRMVAKIEE